MATLTALKVLVSGRVQGVGYRYFAQTWAQQYGLTGYARNLSDGTVEVVAVGPQKVLADFLRQLHQGPASARVDHCQVSWLDGGEPFADFCIRP